MAIEVEISTHIERPPAEVYAAVADLDAWPRWLIASGIVAVHRAPGIAGTPPMPGETMVIEQRAAGRAGTFQVVVRGIAPGGRLTLEGRDEEGVKILIDAQVQPAPSGTDLHWSFRIEVPFRYRIFEGMARPQVQRAAALDCEALRLRLESSPTD